MLKDLSAFNGKLENDILNINGVKFKYLVIPYSEYITRELALFIKNAEGFEIIFADKMPEGISNEVDSKKADELLKFCEKCKVIKLEELADSLNEREISSAKLKRKFPDLTFYHYFREGNIYMFQNESAYETFCGEVELAVRENAVIYNGLENKFERLKVNNKGGKSSIYLELKPYESCVIMENDDIQIDELNDYVPMTEKISECDKVSDLSYDWKVSKLKNKDYPDFKEYTEMRRLEPISKDDPLFAGIIRYEKKIDLEDINEQAYLNFEYVYEAMELWVNGEYAGMKLCPPYIYDVSEYLKKGTNTIQAEVATTLDRERFTRPDPPFIISYDAIDPTGMFGDIKLYYR